MTEPFYNIQDYAREISNVLSSLTLDDAIRLLETHLLQDKTVFSCGNGGSASIAEHLSCDCMKGVAGDTTLKPRVVSLVSNVALMTAIANDKSYLDVFASQLAWMGREGDLLIAISSSGKSHNIVEAIIEANRIGMETLAIVGFDGGEAAHFAKHVIHIESDNYGIIEDASQAVMHFMAQTIRRKWSDKNDREIKY